jgi:deoxyribonucleoside regulator
MDLMREVTERDILKVCYLYYKEGKTQQEVSSLLGVSRFKISRILKEGRQRGLVSITINDPRGDLTELEVELAKKFGLKQTILVQISEFSGLSVLDQVGEAGAQYLNKIVKNYKIMGVTWGYTVYHVVSNLQPVQVEDLTLVQIGGGLGTIEGTDNNMLTMMLGQKLGAKAHLVPAPVIVGNRTIRDTLFKEKKIQEALAIAKKADLVLFGVGRVGKEGLLWKSGFLDGSDTSKLRESGAVGAICGRFFDANGLQCWNDLDNRTIGLNLDELKKIKHKVCIASGLEKLNGILGALRGRLLDVLITDENTAGSLLTQA